MPNVGRRPSYRTAEWRTHQRRRVYERDGYRCRQCRRLGKQQGGPVVLTLQHLIPERVLADRGRVAADHELVTLCRACHGRADGGRRYRWNGRPA